MSLTYSEKASADSLVKKIKEEEEEKKLSKSKGKGGKGYAYKPKLRPSSSPGKGTSEIDRNPQRDEGKEPQKGSPRDIEIFALEGNREFHEVAYKSMKEGLGEFEYKGKLYPTQESLEVWDKVVGKGKEVSKPKPDLKDPIKKPLMGGDLAPPIQKLP